MIYTVDNHALIVDNHALIVDNHAFVVDKQAIIELKVNYFKILHFSLFIRIS